MRPHCFLLATLTLGCSNDASNQEKSTIEQNETDISDTAEADTDTNPSNNDNGLAPLSPGDLIITEIMHNPKAVDDRSGEWLEIYNTTSTEVNLRGLKIGSRFTVEATVEDNLNIAANGYVVLGNNADSSGNGGVSVDYAYSDLHLGNNGKELVLTYQGVIIDAVDYATAGFPDPAGASMSLNSASFSDTANDDGNNWCASTTDMGSGDFGTPGSANDDCHTFIGTDGDGDGYGSISSGGSDCDDSDPNTHPGATDYDDDNIDQDCDGDAFTLGSCNDNCEYAGDGDCDDGGPFASYNLCDFGSDCSDCGPRLDMDQDGQYDDQGGTPLNSNLVMD
ncbi:MAG: lamin tail domain-containing protein, partial [Myxococcota bacterium]|nr:lamin tail domain-containing protein [Myxococcota bacterium]